jgi:biopolymer transport protein ExbD
MIDIIFLLIIFFVVTANFDQTQVDSEVALPDVDSAAIKTLPQERLMINVLADGSVRTGFHHLPQAEIQEKLGPVMKSLKADKENTVLIINGDRETPYRHISTVMNIAALAGYSQVRINAEVKEAGP